VDIRLLKAMVIGDGCLDIRDRYRNARFSIMHSVKQKDYLLWKKDLLEAGGFRTSYFEFENVTNPHTGKKALMCRIESNVSVELTILRGQLYPKSEGFKPGVLDDLEDIHLAIIFMDDGTRCVTKTCGTTLKGKRYTYPCDPYISSFRFALQSHGFSGANQFCVWLKDKFSVDARVVQQAGQAVVSIYRNASKKKFRHIVTPHIHTSLAYKIDGTFKCHSIRRERLSEKAPDQVVRQSDLTGNEP